MGPALGRVGIVDQLIGRGTFGAEMPATDGAVRVTLDAQYLAVLVVDALAAADAAIGADRDGHLRVANARVQLLAAPAHGIGDEADVAAHDVTQSTPLLVRCRCHRRSFRERR